jgi:DNA-binding MarR family transcriptional regulator
MSVGALARKVSLSAATLSGILDRLEAKGLVERTRSQSDRRSVVVRVTREASRWFDGDLSLFDAESSNRLAALSNHERQSILDALNRLTNLLGKTSDASSNPTGTDDRKTQGTPIQELAAKEQ